ncbi:MAG: DUF1501 domain-containing protein [Chloroflexi bacterium]|nr:DUF1501 domain-containing protein [Chloroflexota bacterium]
MRIEPETTVTRRGFLRGAMSVGAGAGAIGISQSLFPTWMPRLAFNPKGPSGQEAANRDVMVVIFLRGGIDGLSAVVPFGEGAAFYDKRPSQRVMEPGGSNESSLDLDGFFGMHQSMAPLKEIYDDQQLAVVHATGLTDPTRSHFDAMLFMEYGTPGSKTTSMGWIARHLETASWQNDSPFRAIGFGTTLPSSLQGSPAPLSLQSIADFHLRGREDELLRMQQALQTLYGVQAPSDDLERQASLVFSTISLLEDLNVSGYAPAAGADYPGDEEGFALGLQQVAQLIKADVGLEVATLDLGGWDTHENQGTHDGTFSYLLDTLSRSLHAFYADLDDRM